MRDYWRGSAYVLLSAFFYGLLPIFARFAYAGGVGVQVLLLFRFSISFLTMGALLGLTKRARLPSRRQLLTMIGLGAIGYFFQSNFYFLSLLFVPVAVTALILYLYPALVTTASFLLGYERASTRILLSLGLALIGSALVANPIFNIDVRGVIFAFAAAVTYTCFILISSKELKDVEGELTAFYIIGGATLSFIIYSLGKGTIEIGWSAEVWLWILMISIVSTSLAVMLFFRGLRIVGPSRTSILSTVELITSVVVAAIVFRELLSPIQIIGGLMILLGAILAALGSLKP